MAKVRFALDESAKLEVPPLELTRVPCQGEFVRLGSGRLLVVVAVAHTPDGFEEPDDVDAVVIARPADERMMLDHGHRALYGTSLPAGGSREPLDAGE
jgi:hypothetical protein